MTDQELLYMLRNNVGVSVAACRAAKEAADRIEALTAKLTKVAVVLQWIKDHRDVCFIPEPWDDMANDVLAELEGNDA